MAGQYDRLVPPGESGTIPVLLSTKRGGPLSKWVKVYTNIPDQEGLVKLTIQGEVWQPVDPKPRAASFGRIAPDAAQEGALTRKLTIINNMEGEAKLTDVRSTNPSFDVETTVIEPGKKFELTVSVVSSLLPGDNRGTIEMSTGITEMPTLSVPVRAYVMSEVDVNPTTVTLRGQQLRDMKRRLTVQNNTKKPLKISDLKTSNPALKVALQETRPGTRFMITVDIPVGYEVPSGGDKITFKTDSPVAPEVTVPVTEAPYLHRAGAGQAGTARSTRVPSAGRKEVPQPPVPAKAEPKATGKPATGKAEPKGAKDADD